MVAASMQRDIRSHKAQVRRRDPAEVRKHGSEIAVIHAEPRCQGGEILIASRRRYPAACVGIIGAFDCERWELAVGLLAVNGATHNQVVAARAMVGALAVAWEGAPEIAARKGGDPLVEIGIAALSPDLFHRSLECEQALADLGQEVGMGAGGGGCGYLVGMGVVAANSAEENLSLHSKAASGDTAAASLDEAGDHLELRAEV